MEQSVEVARGQSQLQRHHHRRLIRRAPLTVLPEADSVSQPPVLRSQGTDGHMLSSQNRKLIVVLASVTGVAGVVIGLGGLIVAIGGFYYAGSQLRLSKLTAQATFLLHLDEHLRQYDNVHRKLDSEDGPRWNPSEDDWPAIEAYMGVFERMQFLVERRVLNIQTVDRLYSYRIINIVRNDRIRSEKLCKKAEFWPDFYELWHSLQGERYWQKNIKYLGEPTASQVKPPAWQRP